MKFKFISYLLSCIFILICCVSCMSDKEYILRKQQLDNQAKHPTTYDLFTVEGPIEIKIADGGKAKVTVPNQPFKEVHIPDGIKTQEQLIAHLIDIGAISVLGWKSLENANGKKVNTTNIYNQGVTTP